MIRAKKPERAAGALPWSMTAIAGAKRKLRIRTQTRTCRQEARRSRPGLAAQGRIFRNRPQHQDRRGQNYFPNKGRRPATILLKNEKTSPTRSF